MIILFLLDCCYGKSLILLYYKDLFTHKDINTYINGVLLICLNKFFLKIQISKRKEKKYAKLYTNRQH